MFIDTTMTPKVDELLRGLIVQSGNDAAIALAPRIGAFLQQTMHEASTMADSRAQLEALIGGMVR